MAGSLKRRHEESTCAVDPLSETQLRKEDVATSFNASYLADEDRVNSPNNIMEAHRMFAPPMRESKRTLSFSKQHDKHHHHDEDAEKRVTIWNWREQRKLSGNSAPFKKNLQEYIRKHPDWEEYVGQDKDTVTGKKLSPKKMLPPAPRDPNHPYYQMQSQTSQNASAPSTVAAAAAAVPAPAHTQMSYGTRSSQSRCRDAVPPPSTHSMAICKPSPSILPELLQHIPIVLESPTAVAMRRSIEMTARRKAMQQVVEDRLTDGEKLAEAKVADEERDAKAAEAAAWSAATEAVAKERAEKQAARLKAAEQSRESRRRVHAEEQGQVAGLAMERILASKKRRMMAA